ncbi:MAG TPA: DUF983 domain-containing protein [Afifellaceae bacterium]|nr:DUF983 domain-containing protein [Afifellaceae bacterium]
MDHDGALYATQAPIPTGLRGRCPRCGDGRLFTGFLRIRESCPACGLDFAFADSADGPAVFVILIVGFLVAGAALVTEIAWQPAMWLHAVLWGPLVVGLSLALLRPLKGLAVALQYVIRAREGQLDPPS